MKINENQFELYSGVEVSLLHTIRDKLNFTYQIYPCKPPIFSKNFEKSNITYSIIELLQYNV